MSEMLALEAGPYVAPENAVELGDRMVDDKKLILNIGEKAIVDIVHTEMVEQHELLGPLLLRIEGKPERALDMLNHTALYAEPEDAQRIFGGVKYSAEDLYGTERAA